MANIHKSITELVGHTPLVELTNFNRNNNLKATLIGKLEYFNPSGSIKDRAALNMIEKAEAEGKLKPGGTIVESTSGNTGIALAAFAAARGYHLHIFMEPGCTLERVQILKAYGTTVQYYKDIPGFDEIIAKYGFDNGKLLQQCRSSVMTMGIIIQVSLRMMPTGRRISNPQALRSWKIQMVRLIMRLCLPEQQEHLQELACI